jgi:hypothetical protein
MGEEIEGAMQHAPHWGRHSMMGLYWLKRFRRIITPETDGGRVDMTPQVQDRRERIERMMDSPLPLHQALLILALDEDKGALVSGSSRPIAAALGAALLMELILQGRLCMNENLRLEGRDAGVTGDTELDRVLAEVTAADKARKTSYWVAHLAERPKKLRERLLAGAARQGLLLLDEKDNLSLPRREGGSAKWQLKNCLRTLTLTPTTADLRDISLLALLRAAGLLDLVFTRDELRQANKIVQELVVREALIHPAAQPLEGFERAIVGYLEDED